MTSENLKEPLFRLCSLIVAGPLLLAVGCASHGVDGGSKPAPPAASGTAGPQAAPESYGVVVMAHGGTDDWDAAVSESIQATQADYPVEVAFGMASAASLQAAIDRLEAQGVEQIGVVRLFISGESWLERTQQILGMEPGAPSREEAPPPSGHHDFAATFWRVDSEAEFALSLEGLAEADGMSQVLVDRARNLSSDPAKESVLVLAHGPGDDAENERWIANLGRLAAPLEHELGFRAVEVLTLREDWAEKREVAEARIRSFVEAANEGGGRCLVIPFRVFGFGPYAEVLDGLGYASDGLGLLPHPAVSDWLSQQAESLAAGPFVSGASTAPSAPASLVNRP